jgi:transposase InsO family protein
VLDAYSRRVIGWALDRSLEDELTIAALSMALAQRIPTPGLVHHSDRGVQYASQDYTDLLKSRGITISMSRKGNPYDNAACESFMKTLKYEEVHRQEYRDLVQARSSIQPFSGARVQRKAPPLGARIPAAGRIRAAVTAATSAAGTSMSPSMRFLRHGGIYRSDVGQNHLHPGWLRRLPLVGYARISLVDLVN